MLRAMLARAGHFSMVSVRGRRIFSRPCFEGTICGMNSSSSSFPSEIPPEESLIRYPCDFPIKVMGANDTAFLQEIVRLTQQFDANFSEKRVQIRVSSGAKYMSLTLTVKATSRTQLDDLYRALTSHPLVKYVL